MKEELLVLLSRYFYYKPVELRKILLGFSDLKKVLTAPKDAFLKLEIGGKALDDFLEERASFSVIARRPGDEAISFKTGLLHPDYRVRNDTLGDIKIITILDADYPAALKNIFDPPPILFYKGDLDVLKNNCLAVIGSRRMTEYGRRAGEMLVKDLCPHFVIISGLAYGVDGLAHEITVKSGQKTAAVLGSGLDELSIYPKSNLTLAKKIIETGGLLLTEIPPGIRTQLFHFPMRNRIIAGISRGILIIEGGKKSGTLITAKLGLEYGTDIFAIPGSIFSPNSEGVNYLIKYGAHPIVSAEDILEFYGLDDKKEKKEYAPKNEIEKNILENLTGDGLEMDELARLTGTAIADLMGALTDLEMEGVIKNIRGKYVKI